MTFWPRRIALVAGVLLLSARASAKQVWSADDGDSLVEVKAFYKGFAAWLAFPSGLVDETNALQNLENQVRPLLPPGEAAQLPAIPTIPWEGGLSTQSVRGQIRFLWKRRIELTAAWELDATIASAPALVNGVGFGATTQGLTAPLASRRLVDIKSVLVSDLGFQLTENLDLLAMKIALPAGELIVGRQVLSWGTGRFWNPTDLLSPFAPTDIDREVRHGIDAVRYSVPLGATAIFDVLFLPQEQGPSEGGAARAQFNVRGFDLSISVAKYTTDLVAGADFAGDIGPVSVHGEAAYTVSLGGLGSSSVRIAQQYLRAVAGADYRPLSKLTLSLEYYFNGFGATAPSGYLAKLTSVQEETGEVFGAGRHYVGFAAAYQATELLTVSTTAILNAQDPSCEIVPAVEWWVEQSVLLRAGGYIPIGAAPNPGPIRAITPADIIAGNTAYASTLSSYGLRSEYGSAPGGLFAQVGIYY